VIGAAVDDYGDIPARAAVRWPARTALRFEDRSWTFAAFDAQVEAAANRLAAAGVRAGDRVALLVANRPEYLFAQFAVARLGAAFVTPNPYWTPGEVERALALTGTTAVVHDTAFDGLATKFGIAVATDLLRDEAPPRTEVAPRGASDICYVPFSSGTTGLPKGVLHTRSSLTGAVAQLGRHLALSKDDRLQIALPLCHIFGATMCAAALSVGAELTLFRRFDLDESLRHIRAAQVTIWPMAGAVAHQISGRNDLSPDDFASLRYFMWGGSAVPAALAERITERTGVPFLCSYGMTEAMMIAFNPVDSQENWRLDSPGFPTAGTEWRLDADGELHVRGPSVASGYAGTDSPDFLPDGWFRTGDRATISADGRLHIVDRVKDMLKVSGFQVAPTEVEMALLEHASVADVAVVGRPDDRTGEAVVAFVVAHEPLDVNELDGWLRDRLATYKRPQEYRVVDEFPRTAGGKIRRAQLRARLTDRDQPSSS
jgi:long-chain acyl-CoA synthetase